jgi:hypothetical protein
MLNGELDFLIIAVVDMMDTMGADMEEDVLYCKKLKFLYYCDIKLLL